MLRDKYQKPTSQAGASSNTGAVSSGSPQSKIATPSVDQLDNELRKTAKSAVAHAKEIEKKLFDASDELENALDNLQNARDDKLRGNRQVNVDKQLDDAKKQVREAAEALKTAANDNVEAWKQASDATKAEAKLYDDDDRASALTKAIVEGHTKSSLQYRDAALQNSKEAIEEVQQP